MKEKPTKASALVGKSLAHIQHGFDSVCSWGFVELKKVSSNSDKTENKFLKFTKKIGGFIGEAGENYYQEYESLKNRGKAKKK